MRGGGGVIGVQHHRGASEGEVVADGKAFSLGSIRGEHHRGGGVSGVQQQREVVVGMLGQLRREMGWHQSRMPATQATP